jgi:glycerol uptake facilitator-like aquaporin
MSASLARRAAAEAAGTALLPATVVGSGIMAERLASGNVALALLANAIATGGALTALTLSFGPISGAHFNPAVTLMDAWQRGIPRRAVPAYLLAQVGGALVGVALANMMFGFPLFFASHHARTGGNQWLSECVATFGLLVTIWGCARSRPTAAPYAVAAYIVAAYWFTPSTSFANPAATLARALHGHVRRHPTDRRSSVHPRATRRKFCRRGVFRVACAVASTPRRSRRRSPFRGKQRCPYPRVNH